MDDISSLLPRLLNQSCLSVVGLQGKLSQGSPGQGATNYVGFRKIILILYLLQKIVVPLLIVSNDIETYYYSVKLGYDESVIVQAKLIEMTRTLIYGLIYLISSIVSLCMLWCLQKSLKQSVDAMNNGSDSINQHLTV